MTDNQYLLTLTVRSSPPPPFFPLNQRTHADILLQLRDIRSPLQHLSQTSPSIRMVIHPDVFLGYHDGKSPFPGN